MTIQPMSSPGIKANDVKDYNGPKIYRRCKGKREWERVVALCKEVQGEKRGKASQDYVAELFRYLQAHGFIAWVEETLKQSAPDRRGIDFFGLASDAEGGFRFNVDVKSSREGISIALEKYGDRGILLFAPQKKEPQEKEAMRLFSELKKYYIKNRYQIAA
ncbi:MAG: hypothetical protein COU90_00495 [Candidatus Ryanbacteria bacterium CG10_big_fil_rev_8_21_14_0_10_43_42]|uniref:Uncharacterized protein n=1 Tax=Candidatus Ryanbacteria bacterium CG10_big_fil_rev_8_21_14_0_10_43_42 TaxID=1974864 RepID=A0A2M8KXS3_9BACT|nr:MAG: hypothetical protein COU90_00495 [Candidatus Ryanbacteria bacterium CG10_big_fil_rev_8_21_14_0_10_43_42]